MELTVRPELAGVSGPCPGCGQTIQSPAPLAEPASQIPTAAVDVVPSDEAVPAIPPRKLRPQPRPMKSKTSSPVLEEPVGPLMEPSAAPGALSSRGQGRAIHPVVGLSSKYDDQREAGLVIRVTLAVLLTLGIVIVITMFLTNQ